MRRTQSTNTGYHTRMHKISVIGNGIIGSTIAKTFGNVTVYGRNDNPVQDTHSTLIVAAPCGSPVLVEQDPEKDLLDCTKVVDTVSKCVYNKLIHISSRDVLYPTIYGKNRKWLEDQILQLPNSVSLRIGKALAPGLTRNILADINTGQWLNKINLNSTDQWYPINRILVDSDSLFASDSNVDIFLSRPITNNEIVMQYKPELAQQLAKNTAPVLQRDAKHSSGTYIVPEQTVWEIFYTYFVDIT